MRAVLKRPCRACNAPIEFHTGPNGKAIPLQRVRTLYFVDATGTVRAEKADGVLISHWETCSDPARFKRPREGADAPRSPAR